MTEPTIPEIANHLRLFDHPDEDSTLEHAQEWLELNAPAIARKLVTAQADADEWARKCAALEAENARLREYFNAVEALDGHGISHSMLDRVNAARDAITQKEPKP